MLKKYLARSGWTIGRHTREIARPWRDAGLTPGPMAAWLNVGCFDAGAARRLIDQGFTPGNVLPEDACAYARGDIALEQIRRR